LGALGALCIVQCALCIVPLLSPPHPHVVGWSKIGALEIIWHVFDGGMSDEGIEGMSDESTS
jgi:hypothetical protein